MPVQVISHKKSTDRKLVVLDLDNTCICAIEKDRLNSVANPTFYVNENQFVDLEDLYRIYPRPKLQEFLDILFRDFNVAVWTAADLDYALFVIDNFITMNNPERELQFIMWGEHCEYSSEHSVDEQAKLLTLLSLPLENPLFDINKMVLIDDNELVLRQKQDTIDSNYFDVTKHDAIYDLYFPYTCIELITSHFNKRDSDIKKYELIAEIGKRI